jgi:hypothetical protein
MAGVVLGVLLVGLFIGGWFFPRGVGVDFFPLATGGLELYKSAQPQEGKGSPGGGVSVPLYPPGVPEKDRVEFVDAGGRGAQFATGMSPEEVLGYFRGVLAPSGWREVRASEGSSPGRVVAVFVRDGWRLFVSAGREKDRTRGQTLLLVSRKE